jgi:hypothetical protein
MMPLPALSPEERAYLQSAQPNSALQALAGRLRRHLMVGLGQAAAVGASPASQAPGLLRGSEPVIRISAELAAAWLSVRFGGKPGAESLQLRDDALVDPFRMLIRRALAETVINLVDAVWPPAIQMQVDIGAQQGVVEIFWNSERAVAWARRTIREKP